MKHIVPVGAGKVASIVCDRCGSAAELGDLDARDFVSINCVGGYESAFCDGVKVELDLCQKCLKAALGSWLRVTTDRDRELLSAIAELNAGQSDNQTSAAALEQFADQARDAADRSVRAINSALEAVEASNQRIEKMERAARETLNSPMHARSNVGHALVEQDANSGAFIAKIIGFPDIEFRAPSFAQVEAEVRTCIHRMQSAESLVPKSRFVGVIAIETSAGFSEDVPDKYSRKSRPRES